MTQYPQLANRQVHTKISFKEITWEQIHQLFTRLVEEMMKSSNFDRDLMERCIAMIVWKLEGVENASLTQDAELEEFGIYTRFSALLSENYSKMRKVEDYSQAIGMVSRKITNACFRYTGRSAKALIEERLISEARLNLRTRTKPIKSIAVNLGFFDQYQFSKFFKKHTGFSPTEFRLKYTIK